MKARYINALDEGFSVPEEYGETIIVSCYKDLKSFVSFFFVYLALSTPTEIESQLISTSNKHVEYWRLYQGMLVSITDSNTSSEAGMIDVVQQLSMLPEELRKLAYNNIKHCFVPMTAESEAFEEAYQDAVLQNRLYNS